MAEYQGAGAPQSGGVATAPAPAPTAAPAAAFPRVNLIPDSIAEQERVHRAKLVLVGAGLVSVALIGGLYVLAQGEVTSAQEEVDAATTVSSQLSAQKAEYAEVPKTFAAVTAAETQLTTAMSGEVRWSYQLNNLALTIPNGVALLSYQGTLGADSTTPAPGTTPDPTAVGTVQFTGQALTYPKVASWLNSVAKQPGLKSAYLSTAERKPGENDNPDTIDFSSSATLGNKALSHRFDGTGN
jgi:Tfp pilus assembly protein PilN